MIKTESFILGKKFVFYTDNGVFSKGGIDFGSSLLLRTINVKDAKTLLDVGCGYGTIGLTIAKTNPECFVEMVDVNLRAIDLAKQNMTLNEIKNAEIFRFYERRSTPC